ncbi:MAG: hypothetical protein ACOX24_06685 [Christensenellales bacterium]|jgi:hypothetical protein
MKISAEEKLMYEVMKAIYVSGIPVSFKGSMVLKAYLLEAGYFEDTRHTVDIDANWNSGSTPTIEQIAESFQKALDENFINLKVIPYRKYSDNISAGFELRDMASKEVIFTMDVDVNRSIPMTKIYEISGLCFRGVVISQMIADKVYVVSSDKIFQRIKDLVDLYYISHVCDFNRGDVLNILKSNNRKFGRFDGFLNRIDDLKHSYEKFRFGGDINKPPFEEVYQVVKNFIAGVI